MIKDTQQYLDANLAVFNKGKDADTVGALYPTFSAMARATGYAIVRKDHPYQGTTVDLARAVLKTPNEEDLPTPLELQRREYVSALYVRFGEVYGLRDQPSDPNFVFQSPAREDGQYTNVDALVDVFSGMIHALNSEPRQNFTFRGNTLDVVHAVGQNGNSLGNHDGNGAFAFAKNLYERFGEAYNLARPKVIMSSIGNMQHGSVQLART